MGSIRSPAKAERLRAESGYDSVVAPGRQSPRFVEQLRGGTRRHRRPRGS
ncbi:hypothetical protein ACIBW9_18095 [Streptomyces sp. NPDC049541]